MVYTIDAIPPIGIGTILALIGAVIYLGIRLAILFFFNKVRKLAKENKSK